jgi:predicted TIM-barrel fold metal-dependent hydrolase
MQTIAAPTASDISPGATGALIDGDGHLLEDTVAIQERLDSPYREHRRSQHLFPPLGFLNSISFHSAGTHNRGPEERGDDPDSWLHFLDAVGIDQTVLYPTYALTVNRLRDLDYAAAICRAYNDWVADTYVRHPSGKFQAVAVLPMQDPAAAVAELKRAVSELGLCAGVVQAHGMPNHLGSECFYPVYEAAQELDVGIACHGAGFEGFGFDDFNVYAPVNALGHPFSQLIALGGMVFNGVFETFPSLRVAYLEAGAGWILMAGERFTEAFKALPPYEGARGLTLAKGTSVLDYLRDLVAQDRLVMGAEGGEHHLATAINYLGGQPFMYSTDFPHEVDVASCRHELEELEEQGLDAESLRLLRGGTARKFYRL